MKKEYKFWLDDQKEFNQNNPLSSMKNFTLCNAKNWAIYLLRFHSKANTVYFMSENGHKIYTEERTAYRNVGI